MLSLGIKEKNENGRRIFACWETSDHAREATSPRGEIGVYCCGRRRNQTIWGAPSKCSYDMALRAPDVEMQERGTDGGFLWVLRLVMLKFPDDGVGRGNQDPIVISVTTNGFVLGPAFLPNRNPYTDLLLD